MSTPGAVSFAGATPTNPIHADRQLNLGERRSLAKGPDIALDLCLSDSGTGKVPAKCKMGAKCEAKSKAKRKKYMARFNGIDSAELCCPGYGRSGSKSTEAVILRMRIIKALVAAIPTVPYSITALRVSQVLAFAMQKAVRAPMTE
jgi:hypothetical protein